MALIIHLSNLEKIRSNFIE